MGGVGRSDSETRGSVLFRRAALGTVWVFVIGTFGPQLRSLWMHADPLGRALLKGQFAVLVLLRLGVRKLVPEIIMEPPAAIVPALSVLALVTGGVFHQRGRPLIAKALLQNLVAWGGIPVVNESIENMIQDVGDADHPALFAMTLGLLLNEPLAATLILIMLTGGEALEEYAMERAQTGIHKLLQQGPGMARRIGLDSQCVEEVPATDLVRGDLLVLRNGDSAPVDCEVRDDVLVTPSGSTAADSYEVDESMVTGESQPQIKTAGDTILSGSISLSAQPFIVRVLKVYSESTMALFKQALAKGLENKSQLERSSIKMASDFTPFTLALCAFSFWWQRLRGGVSAPLALWGRVLAVLMAATPCPAAIGVPIAFLCGMSVSSKKGISIKSGAALENLGKASVCVLDKTGTLTYGRPKVSSMEFLKEEDDGSPRIAMAEISKDEALRLCASLEVGVILPPPHPSTSCARACLAAPFLTSH